jgi:hypothetical protein
MGEKAMGTVMLDQRQLRRAAVGLGLVTLAFGIPPLVAPRRFARAFGFAVPDAGTASMIRSLGVRDTVMGMGLWSAAAHGGNYAPWLLARTLIDGGDTLAIGWAAGAGWRNWRFIGLGALAFGATVLDATLYAAARRAK